MANGAAVVEVVHGFDVEFPHLSEGARELLAAFAGVAHSRAELKCRVRMARVLDAFRQVQWQPNLSAASRISGLPVSTLFDVSVR